MAISVLVVGAGPTGLMLACELRRRGVEVRLIDKLAAPSPLSKAIAVQARSIEILENLGLAKAFLARGLRISGVRVYADHKAIIKIDFNELDTRYPFLLSIAQRDTERLLTERLVELGGAVERGVELSALSQSEASVSATLRTGERDELVDAHWVVGCDGAHSAVRKLAGLEFQGAPFDEPFMLADVRAKWDLPRDQVSSFFHASGIMACFPLPDDLGDASPPRQAKPDEPPHRWRLIASAGSDAEVAHEPSLADFQRLTDERTGEPSELSDPAWLASFRINARQVDRYRQGRVFVAGDAAHIHSPVGGQGMNTGMQDAHNLAWKLALVEHGQAAPELLDSYHAERHRIGAELLKSTDLATRVATFSHPITRGVRNRLASFLTSLEVVQQRVSRTAAELNLSYRGSPIVAEERSGILSSRLGAAETAERPNTSSWLSFGKVGLPGTRAPDGDIYRADGTRLRLAELFDHRHTLLLFDGRAATEVGYVHLVSTARRVRDRFGDLVATHVVVPDPARVELVKWDSVLVDRDRDLEERYGAQAECLYVIRPDLYVGFRSQPIDAEALVGHLASYLRFG